MLAGGLAAVVQPPCQRLVQYFDYQAALPDPDTPVTHVNTPREWSRRSL